MFLYPIVVTILYLDSVKHIENKVLKENIIVLLTWGCSIKDFYNPYILARIDGSSTGAMSESND